MTGKTYATLEALGWRPGNLGPPFDRATILDQDDREIATGELLIDNLQETRLDGKFWPILPTNTQEQQAALVRIITNPKSVLIEGCEPIPLAMIGQCPDEGDGIHFHFHC